jgi:hypothetical protein
MRLHAVKTFSPPVRVFSEAFGHQLLLDDRLFGISLNKLDHE